MVIRVALMVIVSILLVNAKVRAALTASLLPWL